jgi:hypothetical protein
LKQGLISIFLNKEVILAATKKEVEVTSFGSQGVFSYWFQLVRIPKVIPLSLLIRIFVHREVMLWRELGVRCCPLKST